MPDNIDKDADRCLHLDKSHTHTPSEFLKHKSLKYKHSLCLFLLLLRRRVHSLGTLLEQADFRAQRWDCYLLTCKVHRHSQQAGRPTTIATTTTATTSNRANPRETTTVTVQTQRQDSTQLTSRQRRHNIQLETLPTSRIVAKGHDLADRLSDWLSVFLSLSLSAPSHLSAASSSICLQHCPLWQLAAA